MSSRFLWLPISRLSLRRVVGGGGRSSLATSSILRADDLLRLVLCYAVGSSRLRPSRNVIVVLVVDDLTCVASSRCRRWRRSSLATSSILRTDDLQRQVLSNSVDGCCRQMYPIPLEITVVDAAVAQCE